MQRILIDSTIWIKWLRDRVDPRPILHPFLLHSSIYTCGVIHAEVLRGVVSVKQREKLSSFFDLFNDVPLLPSLWKSASELAWTLDRKGLFLPLTDIVIAQVSLICRATIISSDKHFTQIPGLSQIADLEMLAGKG